MITDITSRVFRLGNQWHGVLSYSKPALNPTFPALERVVLVSGPTVTAVYDQLHAAIRDDDMQGEFALIADEIDAAGGWHPGAETAGRGASNTAPNSHSGKNRVIGA